MTTTQHTSSQALTVLTAEGHTTDNVHAAIDSMIDAGLELDQPDDGYVFTAAEMGVLRDQLAGK